MKNTIKMFIAATLLTPVAVMGGIRCELGILTLDTLARDNPATGEPWKVGDQYRLVFLTSTDGDHVGTEYGDIEWYNARMQALADASTAYSISTTDGVTWKVIGSTAAVDARDNTATNPNVHGDGHPVFLLDGNTLIAADFNELWSGTIRNGINVTEKGEERSWHWALTGTLNDGTKRTGTNNASAERTPLGGSAPGQAGSLISEWIYRISTSSTSPLPYYAMSMPLTIRKPDTRIIRMVKE
ncbi:MAG: hypothetical protein ACNA71_09910, partial [Kiritimatiellia bacterium]